MKTLRFLTEKIRTRLPEARLEIAEEKLYIDVGNATFSVTVNGDAYHFTRDPVGFESPYTDDFQTYQEVLEALPAPVKPAETKSKTAPLFTPEELDELEKIARAALPNSWAEHQKWRDQAGYNNAGCPTRFFFIPEHNGNKTIELMEPTSLHIVAFQPEVALRLIAAIRGKT